MPSSPARRHSQREINGMQVLKQEVFIGKIFCLYALAIGLYTAPHLLGGRRSGEARALNFGVSETLPKV
jgi:hypothetical protein